MGVDEVEGLEFRDSETSLFGKGFESRVTFHPETA